jgi:hypothetical protein
VRVSAVLYGIVVVVVLLREECGVAGLETGGRALQRLNGAIVSSGGSCVMGNDPVTEGVTRARATRGQIQARS